MGIDDIIQINSAYSWSPAEKDELKWKTIPRKTAIKVYQKYFADFVIFGYSTEDVIPFINASDPNLGIDTYISEKCTPGRSLRLQSTVNPY